MESSRTYTDQQGNFEMLTPASLEVQIFVDPKEANNVPAELKEKVKEEVQSKAICCRQFGIWPAIVLQSAVSVPF